MLVASINTTKTVLIVISALMVGTAESIYIDEEDTVYQGIIRAMSGYLRKEPTEENILTLDAHLNPDPANETIPTQGTTKHQHQQQQQSFNDIYTALILEESEKLYNKLITQFTNGVITASATIR